MNQISQSFIFSFIGILLCPLFLLPLNAQSDTSFSHKWGKAKECGIYASSPNIFAVTENSFCTYEYVKEDLQLYRYDADLNIVKKKLITAPPERTLLHVLELKDGIYLMSASNKKKVAAQIYQQKIDPITLSFSKETLIGNTLTNCVNKKHDWFSFRVSEDKSKFLITFKRFASASRLSAEGKDMTVWDHTFKMLWQGKVKLPGGDSKFAARQTSITNNGKVIIVGLDYKKKNGKTSNILPEDNQLFIFGEGGKQIGNYAIGLKGKNCNLPIIKDLGEGKILCVAEYYTKENYVLNGYNTHLIDLTKEEVIAQQTTPFSSAIIEENGMSEKDGIRHFGLFDLIPNFETGQATLIFEYADEDMSSNTYRHRNILLCQIDQKGQEQWHQTIVRRYSGIQRSGGFKSTRTKAGILVVYNTMKKTTRHFMTTLISNDGKIINSQEIGEGKGSIALDLLVPEGCASWLDKGMIIYGRKRVAYQFGLLE